MKKEFIVERNGKSFVLYAGLLDEAHTQGLNEIYTELIQVPDEANGQVAIARARVRTEKGCFSGIGDASPANVSNMLSTCLIRMAETRAKARAFRDAVNVGMAALEELADDEVHQAEATPSAHDLSEEELIVGAKRGAAEGRLTCADCGKEMTKGQHDYSMRAFGAAYCPACQRMKAK